MSPREFHALTKCYQDREERMDRSFASMQAVYAQCCGSKLTTEDFMSKPKTKAQKHYPTNEQLERNLTVLFGCGPKKVKNG